MSDPKWCSAHGDETIKTKVKVTLPNKKCFFADALIEKVPPNYGSASNLSSAHMTGSYSNGVGIDQLERQLLASADFTGKSLQVLSEKVYSPKKNYSQETMKFLPSLIMNKVSPVSVSRVKRQLSSSIPSEQIAIENEQTTIENEPHLPTYDRVPTVKPGILDDDVHHYTGFRSETMMLSFIIVVCNGDIDVMNKTYSSLTWFEEWFLFLS